MKTFDEILIDQTKTATKIPQSDYLEDGKYRIFDQGKDYSVGYSNDETGVVSDFPYIVFGDHTRVVKFVNEPCYIGADGVKLLKVYNKDFDTRYVYYNILAKPIVSQGYARHFKFLKEIQFTDAPKDQQIKIAEHLDKIQAAIDNKKQQLSELDELVKSKFVEMFGDPVTNSKNWPVVNFDEAARIDGTMTKDYEKYADYPHIGIDSIMKNTGELVGYRTVKEDNVISGKYIFTDKHIIYSKIRPNLNKVALPDFEGLCSADSYPILVNSENCNRYYLAYVMRSDFFLTYILAHASRAGMPKVNREQIRGFDLPLPPVDLQTSFENFVRKTDSAKSVVKAQLADLQEFLDSMMDKYFGE